MRPSFSVTAGRPRRATGRATWGCVITLPSPRVAENPYRRQSGRVGVAVRADAKAWMWSLVGAAVGAGALARFPLGQASGGLVFVALFAVGLALLAFPLLVAEAALGRLRRRNAVDAFGRGAWRGAGAFTAIAAVALLALVAVLGGWAARYCYLSFQGGFFDDPERTFRVASQGWDALAWTFAVLAAGVGLRQARGGSSSPLVVGLGVAALVAALALGVWGLLQGSAARAAVFAFHWRAIDAALVVTALQQALLPGLVGAGVVASLSSRPGAADPALPKHATSLVLLWALVPLAAGIGLAAFAHDTDTHLGTGLADPFTSIAAVFAAVGGTQGGVLAGLFFGALLVGGLAAVVLLLEVPARWLEDLRNPRSAVAEEGSDPDSQQAGAWSPLLASIAVALAAYIVAAPLAFVASLAESWHVVLLGIVAPLGGLALSLHVGWVRPAALDGYTFGDAGHSLGGTLKPVLRFVLPVLLLALLVLGTMQALAVTGAVEHGSAGLWRLVP